MCEWERDSTVIKTYNSKFDKLREIAVDSCIAGFVKMLNENYYETIASCFGHGKQPIRISLRDGRDIFIMSFEEAQRITQIFPAVNDPFGVRKEIAKRSLEEFGLAEDVYDYEIYDYERWLDSKEGE